MANYIVRKGDTLSAIAQRELGAASRWPEIARLNSLDNPDLIYPGQDLRMPALVTVQGSSKGIISAFFDLFKGR